MNTQQRRGELLDILYNALEVEGEKQEIVSFLSTGKNIISVVDVDGKEWEITLKEAK